MADRDPETSEQSFDEQLQEFIEDKIRSRDRRQAEHLVQRRRRVRAARRFGEHVAAQALGTLLGAALIALFGALLGILPRLDAPQLAAIVAVIVVAALALGFLLFGPPRYPEDADIDAALVLWAEVVTEREKRERASKKASRDESSEK